MQQCAAAVSPAMSTRKRLRSSSPTNDEERVEGAGATEEKTQKKSKCKISQGGALDSCKLDVGTKDAAIRASPCIVNIVTHNIPDVAFYQGCEYIKVHNDELVFPGTGVIVECEDGGDGRYVSTILAPASLFARNTDIKPNEIKVDVYLSDGKLYKGELLACDFHYNLATVSIQSDLPLRTAVLRGLDNFSSIDSNKHCQLCADKSFLLRPHSNLFKILPGAKVIILRRSFIPPYGSFVHLYGRGLQVDSGVFCVHPLRHMDCKELYWVDGIKVKGDYGGAAINDSGEVIGIMFYKSAFLPSNLILRWWNYYKSHREFNLPWLGMDIADFCAVRLDFLEELRNMVPDISTGIVVTKVEEGTPAFFHEIKPKDVILKCDGKIVRSILEFFDKIWDNATKSLKLDILRASDGRQLNLSFTIGVTPPDKYYRWPLPSWETKYT